MKASVWLVRRLQRGGVEQVFALCGNGMDPFLDACLECGMPVIDVRNEQVAAYAADTSGRMTGKLGVVAVSSGPGHTNTVTGLANAWWDGGPMLLISGCSPQATRGLDNFQQLDQVGIVRPICKAAAMIHDAAAMPAQVETILQTAIAGRPGPVHLTVPVDVFEAEIDTEDKAAPLVVRPQGLGEPEAIERAVEMLRAAKRPMAIVGNGAFYAGAGQALMRFCEMTDIPLLSHIWSRGCVERPIPQYLGVTNEVLNGAIAGLARADCVLTIGARIDYRVGYGRAPLMNPDAQVIRIDVEPSEIARTVTPEVGLIGDPRAVLERMVDLAGSGAWQHAGWLADVTAERDGLLEYWGGRCRDDCCPMPGLRICREIKPFLDRDVTFLLDGGNIGRWAHMVLFDRHPAHWFTCGASGVVGWGIAGAIAAKRARPDHPLLLLSGDGAAGFNVTDIETALRFHTPFCMVVAHDGAWGIVVDGQPDDRRVASVVGEIRYDRLCQALGGRGVYIQDPSELTPAIEAGLAADTVTVIQVPTQLAGIEQWDARFGCRE